MMIKVPMMHHVTGRIATKTGKPSKTMDRVKVGEWIAVDVEELTDEEAPVCVSWREHERFGFADPYAVGAEKQVEVRVHGGHYYRQLTTGVKDRTPRTPEELAKTDIPHKEKYDGEWNSDWISFANGQKSFDMPDFVGETLGTREDVLESWARRCGELKVVDGSIWERCSEPRLIVEDDPKMGNVYVTVRPGFVDYDALSRMTVFHFGFDETEAMDDLVRVLSEPHDTVPSIHADVEVHFEDRPRERLACRDIVRLAEKLVARTGSFMPMQKDEDFVYRWNELRRAVKFAQDDDDDEKIDHLVECWCAFAETRWADANAEALAKERALTDRGADQDIRWAEALARRWHDRAVSASAGFNLAHARSI